MKHLINSTALLCCFTMASCATVTRGTTDQVVIKTTPSDAKVVTSLNHTCQTNPCQVEVSRKVPFSVTASKPGFESQTVNVGTKVSGKGAAGMAGNVLVGGVIGIGVDAATGAAKDHYPNPVIINLQPVGSKKKSIEQSLEPPKKKLSPTS